MKQTLFTLGLSLVLLAIFWWAGKSVEVFYRYDERQILAQNRGYKWAFYVMMLAMVVVGFNYDFLSQLLSSEMLLLTIGFLGVWTYIIYAVWQDAYYSKQYRNLGIWVLFDFALAIFYIYNFVNELALARNLSEVWVAFLAAASWSLMALLMGAKYLQSKWLAKDEEE